MKATFFSKVAQTIVLATLISIGQATTLSNPALSDDARLDIDSDSIKSIRYRPNRYFQFKGTDEFGDPRTVEESSLGDQLTLYATRVTYQGRTYENVTSITIRTQRSSPKKNLDECIDAAKGAYENHVLMHVFGSVKLTSKNSKPTFTVTVSSNLLCYREGQIDTI